MIKRKSTILLTLLASSAGLLHAEPDFECCEEAPIVRRSSQECYQEPACCPSSSPQFFLRADLLYWKPHISGLELDFGTTSISQVLDASGQVLTATEFDADPHFKWNCGYRIAAGYEVECSDWEIGLAWTHFQDSGKRDDDTTVESTGRCSLKFDQIDLLLGYKMGFNSCLKLRPFIGVRGAKIHERVRATLITDITLSSTTSAIETLTLNDRQNFHGIGPILGLQGDYDIGCGLSIYGTAAASVLYTTYKIHLIDSDVFTAPISISSFTNTTKHMHELGCNIDLALGIEWQTCICDDMQLNMKLGFEHHQYFNENRLGANRGDLSFDGGVFSLSLAL